LFVPSLQLGIQKIGQRFYGMNPAIEIHEGRHDGATTFDFFGGMHFGWHGALMGNSARPASPSDFRRYQGQQNSKRDGEDERANC
jgi:hypothetical protein